MDKAELGMLVGLIDGEGSFCIRKRTYKGKVEYIPTFALTSTDESITQFVTKAVDGSYQRYTMNPKYQKQYIRMRPETPRPWHPIYRLYLQRPEKLRRLFKLLDGKLLAKQLPMELVIQALDAKEQNDLGQQARLHALCTQVNHDPSLRRPKYRTTTDARQTPTRKQKGRAAPRRPDPVTPCPTQALKYLIRL